MADSYGLEDSSALEMHLDYTSLDRYLHEGSYDLFNQEPERGEHVISESRERNQEQLDLYEVVCSSRCPENDQSFFADFEHSRIEKDVRVEHHQRTLTADVEIGEAHQSFSVPIFLSDLNSEEHSDVLVALGGSNVGDVSPQQRWLGGMDLHETNAVYGQFDTNELRSKPEEVSPIVSAHQIIPLSCEDLSLLNSYVSPPISQLPSIIDTLSPAPLKSSNDVKVNEENFNTSDGDERKERRRLQNRNAATRCRNRKKECYESMIKDLQKEKSEKEHYQKIAVFLKANIQVLTQELRKHQLHCGFTWNPALRSNVQTIPPTPVQLQQPPHES